MKKNRCCEGFRYVFRLSLFTLAFTFFFTIPFTSYSEQENAVLEEGFSRDEINRGRRFFNGLLPFERKHDACVSCHYMISPDTLNWNPSAMDIALKYAGRDTAEFKRAILNPSGAVMEASHQNFELSEDDLYHIKVYLDNLAMTGAEKQKPKINRILLFLFLGLLITWALLDLIIFRKVKYKAIPLLIFLLAFGYQLFMLYEEAVLLGRSPDYQPDQPIKFSHQVHATDNQIDCMYCHH
ncbi:MAG TPA: hypothetical protein VFD91_12275, partial [Mariniphaga sp.]|nr:hypothetical protein [Mariniphaga sp.]